MEIFGCQSRRDTIVIKNFIVPNKFYYILLSPQPCVTPMNSMKFSCHNVGDFFGASSFIDSMSLVVPSHDFQAAIFGCQSPERYNCCKFFYCPQ